MEGTGVGRDVVVLEVGIRLVCRDEVVRLPLWPRRVSCQESETVIHVEEVSARIYVDDLYGGLGGRLCTTPVLRSLTLCIIGE